MYRYYSLFFGILMMLMMMACQNQEKTLLMDQQYDFPEDWLGHWEGELTIYNNSGVSMNLRVALDLKPMDHDSLYPWTMKYITKDHTDERNYFLKKGDKQENHWIMDENNGIFLDGYVLDDTYHILFDVGNNRIQTTYQRQGHLLIFQNLVSEVEKIDSSGGIKMDSISIPHVNSYLVKGLQRATLNKIKSDDH